MHPPAVKASSRWTAFLVAGLASACACGCSSAGSGQQGFLDAPLLTMSSASGALQVAVFTNPQPPVRGNVAIRYRITDSAAEPVDGLVLKVVPWMPAMSHSSSAEPAVSAAGSGVYDSEQCLPLHGRPVAAEHDDHRRHERQCGAQLHGAVVRVRASEVRCCSSGWRCRPTPSPRPVVRARPL